jgi:Domain of unknown function (DUF222)/HNH endonuclease
MAVTIASTPTHSQGRSSSPSRTIDELDAAIGRLASRINAESYRLLMLVREFDDRLGWAKWSYPSCAEWLAWRFGLSLSAARERVRTAHALRGLPAISAAFASGRLSYSKVRALTRVAGLRDEEPLLAYALEASASQVEERCRQIRNVSPESVGVARRAWERRSLSMYRNDARGTMTISVEVPIEEGEVIARALDRAVEAGEIEQGPEFEAAGWHAQQADALVAVAKSYLGGGARDSTTAADHYQVVVHVDEAALRGGVGRSDLPIETVKRLTCDGSLIAVLEGDRGTPLNVGRKQRTVSTFLRRALWSRDRGCTFPGCRHTRFVEAHHIRHWADGGETKLENTTLLCSYHHRLLHEGDFRIRRDHEGAIYFQRTDGRVIPRGGYRAEDVLDDDIALDSLDDALSEGARLAAIVHSRNPSAEVRETAGIYLLRNVACRAV